MIDQDGGGTQIKYRMYIDEVGNPDLGSSRDPNHRYLNLTAVIMELGYVQSTAAPAMEALKTKYFSSHPDDPVIFHRKEMLNTRNLFYPLQDPIIRKQFDRELMQYLEHTRFIALSVTIDKLEHLNRYGAWAKHPYHYCLETLVERFVLRLLEREADGDVMAESRGGKEDMRLKKSFHRLYQQGNNNIDAGKFQNRLTSSQLKVKPKIANICGLQVADLIAHPMFKAMLAIRNKQAIPSNFGGTIFTMLKKRNGIHAGPGGKLDGWGLKWLP